jgi:hypothetical protein
MDADRLAKKIIEKLTEFGALPPDLDDDDLIWQLARWLEEQGING